MRPLALNTVVYNEAPRILGLLSHAAAYCDELVVVDQSSTDGTGDFARDFGATVITDRCHGFNEPSRPLAEANTTAPWIIALDADEMIQRRYIPELVGLPEQYLAAIMGCESWVGGERVTYNLDVKLRYFRRGTVRFSDKVHTRIHLKPESGSEQGPETFVTGDPWILHIKSQAEHDYDHARYVEMGAYAKASR